jgi:hypothetical protein
MPTPAPSSGLSASVVRQPLDATLKAPTTCPGSGTGGAVTLYALPDAETAPPLAVHPRCPSRFSQALLVKVTTELVKTTRGSPPLPLPYPNVTPAASAFGQTRHL